MSISEILFGFRILVQYLVGLFSIIVLCWLMVADLSASVEEEDVEVSTIVLGKSDKSHNAIVVSHQEQLLDIDKTGQYVALSASKPMPKEPKEMSQEEIGERFSDAIDAEPEKAESFMLYFGHDGRTLKAESQDKLSLIIERIQKKSPCIVDVIGHTDTTGSSEQNIAISLKRAEIIKKLLVELNVDSDTLNVKGFGEEDLLVATADNINEERNRNVEIFIK